MSAFSGLAGPDESIQQRKEACDGLVALHASMHTGRLSLSRPATIDMLVCAATHLYTGLSLQLKQGRVKVASVVNGSCGKHWSHDHDYLPAL